MFLQTREDTHGSPPSPGSPRTKIVPSDYESFAFTAGRDNCRGHQQPAALLCREEHPHPPGSAAVPGTERAPPVPVTSSTPAAAEPPRCLLEKLRTSCEVEERTVQGFELSCGGSVLSVLFSVVNHGTLGAGRGSALSPPRRPQVSRQEDALPG